MQRIWPIIGVSDVRLSAHWYQHLLGASHTNADSPVFEQILSADFEVLVCLHHWGPSGPRGDHHWSAFKNRSSACPGHGLMLWFVVEDFEAAWERARTAGLQVVEPPNTDNGTGLRAFVVVDPDGHHVAVNEG